MNINLEVEIVEQDSTAIVLLAGEIDAYTAPKLKEALLPLAKQQGLLIEVNLEKVNYMDSTGLGVFISALKATKESGSELKLVQLQDRVKRLFEITALDSIITIDSTVRGGK
ncbi:anti-sigma factor antagonist [Aquibacillus koreensis]|uniref:Anti-sigma factor antagonist n=1 Tax=Aquibacillus koreensis TaxID=279446 RepID=A0A9X4AJS8_9BACI|nr:anti-sigma factor antagonist [Aquibacillus koreensis]MCT2534967.1 anti-sigma factor antagonist [Aquibacillus koreensis]MDC3422139.1 anti-sigma factor antagonist [Aquibacillus koreensis]